jgi:hypothetical protein
MTLERSTDPPWRPMRSVIRIVIAALLVGAGVAGQRIADAVAESNHWNDRYDLELTLAAWSAQEPDDSSCEHALASLAAIPGPDEWGHEYSMTCVMGGEHAVVILVSAGPDGELGTADDLVGIRSRHRRGGHADH